MPVAKSLPERTKGCCQTLPEPLGDADALDLAEMFRALSDPIRVQMIHMLQMAIDPVCVCDFTAVFDIGQPTVSHHLAKLRDAGLVESFKSGIWMFYRLNREMGQEVRRALSAIP